MEDNNLHTDELDNGFEKDLESAFALNERMAIKSLIKNIENQNELIETEVERAFILNERKRLKTQFKEIEDAEKFEFGDKIAAANSNNTYDSVGTQIINKKSNWKRFAIAASIFGLLLTTGIWILNTKNSAPDKDFVKLETKEITNQDSINSTLKQQQEYFVVLNNSKCISSVTIDINKIKQFGFGSNKNEKIKVVNYNIDLQISILKEYASRTLLDSNYYLNNLIKSNIDSINALKNKYTFDLNTLKTYNINSEDVKVYFVKDQYYIRAASYYYVLSKSKTPINLKKVNDDDIIGLLDAL